MHHTPRDHPCKEKKGKGNQKHYNNNNNYMGNHYCTYSTRAHAAAMGAMVGVNAGKLKTTEGLPSKASPLFLYSVLYAVCSVQRNG